MNTFKMYELGNADACQDRRNFALLVEDKKNDIFEKSSIIKAVLKDYYDGKILYSEIEEELADKFSTVSYKSREQKFVNFSDALRQIMRYINSEERKPCILLPRDTQVSDEMTVVATPDFYFLNVGQKTTELEVVKLKCSKPKLTSRTAGKDIGLYSLLCYARDMIDEASEEAARLGYPPIVTLKASYYYLVKNNDSYSSDKPNFDSDFFRNSDGKFNVGGNNIVSICDDIQASSYTSVFQPICEQFVDGLPSEECSASDCNSCQLKHICKFTEPPIALTKNSVQKSLSSLSLTEAQRKAIDYEEGICRINAGAGAGKTMVIALRTATLIEKGVDPKSIFLCTFTNAGAEEMRSRIEKCLEDSGIETDISEMAIMTFNSFGDEVIKAHYEDLGFTEPPVVIDDIERSHIIAELLNEAVSESLVYDAAGHKMRNPLKQLNWRNFTSDTRYARGALSTAKRVFDIVKANNYSVFDLAEAMQTFRSHGLNLPTMCAEALISLYEKYDDTLHRENLIEFADQEIMLFELLTQHYDLLESLGFSHIIVDEFQDSNKKQVELVKLFTECNNFKSLMVVGDDSQSIYLFRNTSPEYIINFDKYVSPNFDDMYLMENHRSTPEILEFANTINQNNVHRVAKNLVATKPHGKPVVVKGFLTQKEEREFVIDDIKKHLSDGCKHENIAIICYTKTELQAMASLLQEENIPSVMLNPEPLLENSRVNAAIALVNAIQDPTDTKDIIIFTNADIGGGMLKMSADEIATYTARTSDWIKEFNKVGNPITKQEMLLDKLRSIDHYEDEVYQSFLETLSRKAWNKIIEYIEEFYLYGSTAAVRRVHDYPGIVLTTAHSSKGLEWPIVYNMISKYHDESLPSRLDAVEDRRRLFFVSATRAMDELIVTSQYTAFGKQGDYTYNRFLVEAYKAVGMAFSHANIESEREMRAALRKQANAKARKQKQAEMKAKKAEMAS